MEMNIFNVKVVVNLSPRSMSMLFILWAIVIISYFFMTKIRKSRVLKFANFYTLKKVHRFKSILPSPWILFTKLLVVTLLFLVATESIEVSLVKPVANTDFCIALDVSQTMLLPDYEPNRLEFAKSTIEKWLDELPGASAICVIKFADRPVPLTSLSLNTFEVKRIVRSIEAESNSTGTAIGEAIFAGVSILKESDKQRFLIIITDGKNNVGRNVTSAIKEAEKNHVVVYTLGIESTNETRALFEQLKQIAEEKNIQGNLTFPEIDKWELRMIAEETGGKFYSIKDENAFKEAMQSVIFKNERIPLNSDYYILVFISVLLALELVVFSKFGAI